ncbi:MAG TPA: response regulator [Pyrinomonadaceae bacterium]
MSKRKLLLADDSITIQKVVNLTFADEGVEVITVGDGDSAAQKISEVSPDLILADVHMPGLNGYQICEMVRSNPGTSKLPVILLVGSFEPFDESEAARVGANAYLTKPFQSIRQLVSQVTELMEPAESEHRAPEQHVESPAEAAPVQTTHEPEFTASGNFRDTKDIDSLYHQSFGEPVAEEREATSNQFVDAGMDDEMIETRVVSDGTHAAVQEAASREEAASPAAAAETEEAVSFGEAEYDHSGRERLYYEEPASVAPSGEPANDDYSAEAVTSDYTGELAGYQYSTEREANEYAEYNDRPPEPGQTEVEHEPHVDRFASTEPIPQAAALPNTESFRLDEGDLLELPPIEDEKTLEFQANQAFADESGNKQVVSLSPELMETIVAKVVEKLNRDN